jgi:hypothetical protein
MSQRQLKYVIGLSMLTLGLIRLTGTLMDTPMANVLPGWPGLLLAVIAIVVGFRLYLANCAT